MNVLCFIDSLGCGGAQRQMVVLAATMSEMGHQVAVLTYHPDGSFAPLLEERGISWRTIPPYPMAKRLWRLRREFRGFHGDAILAFLEGPSFYAEVLGGRSRRWGLVVSERLVVALRGRARLLRLGHFLADSVISNSHTMERAIADAWTGLQPKSRAIYNVVDLNRFSLAPEAQLAESGRLRVVTMAHYSERKNVAGVIAGLIQACHRGVELEFDWFGANSNIALCQQARGAVREAGLESVLRLNGQTSDPAAACQAADAMILASFAEGLPNAVCEAMACGLPVIMSDVCDARYLVEEGVNGFLFDPHQPSELADRIGRFAALAPAQRAAMGQASRRKAEELFDRHRNTQQYLELLEAAWRKRNKANASS